MEYKINDLVRGVRIISGDEAKYRREILNKLIYIAQENNFNEIILPTIEPSQVYTNKAGKEILNQMYVFKDKKERDICLRPEGTATIQLVADKYYPEQKNVRYWYFEKCYRYERPQKGRYREFFQFGLEIINPVDDAKQELINISKKMVETVTSEYIVSENVKRGLDYYIEDGFEISVDSLGAQKQICGGGRYKQGIGFAIGFDRLVLINQQK
jgi:histidyl-tRNA synthetase